MDFLSDSLKTRVRVQVLLPREEPSPFKKLSGTVQEKFPWLMLIHGISESSESYLLRTQIAEEVNSCGIAAVLPDVGNSFCLDEPNGKSWFRYITDELPTYLQSILPLSERREERFVGGISMGGYASVMAALKRPELFGKAFSMSGTLDISRAESFARIACLDFPCFLRNKELRKGEYDLFEILEGCEPEKTPELLLTCGRGDSFLQSMQSFEKIALEKGISVTSRVSEGDHSWEYWRRTLPECIAWLAGI